MVIPRWAALGAASVAYLGLAFLTFASAWRDPGHVVLGVGGDPLLSLWFLNWTPFALSHHLNPLFTTYLDYPDGVNLMWNTSGPLLGMLLWPANAIWGAVVAYNLAETLGVAASAIAAFYALRRFVPSAWAAFAGGALYGFSPFMMAHALGHPQLIWAITPPLMLVVLHELVVQQRRPAWQSGLLLGVLGAVQILTWEELALSEALVGVLAMVILTAFTRKSRAGQVQHALRGIGVAAGVSLGITAVPLAFQFLGPQQVHGSVWSVDQFVSDALAFITPTPLQAIAPRSALGLSDLFPAKVYEWSSYLGIPLLLLLAFAAVRLWREPLTRFASVTGAFVAILSMGALVILAGRRTPVPVALFAFAFPPMLRKSAPPRPVVYAFLLAWGALVLVPVVNDILPSRLTVFMYLMAALLLALFIESEARTGSRRRALVAAGLTVIALVPLLPRLPYPTTPLPVPAFFTSGAVRQVPDGSVALVTPYAYDWRVAVPMSWQVEAGMRYRMPEGFAWVPGPARFQPHSTVGEWISSIAQGQPVPVMTVEQRAAMLADLRRLNVQTVIVGSADPTDPLVAFFGQLLGRPPVETGGVQVWWNVQEVLATLD